MRVMRTALLVALALASGHALAQVNQTYDDEATFFAAYGVENPTETFDGFEDGDCLDGSEISSMTLPGCSSDVDGVTFTSPEASTLFYVEIQVDATGDAVTPSNVLTGGQIAYTALARPRGLASDVSKNHAGPVGLQLNAPVAAEVPGGALYGPQVIEMHFENANAVGFYVTGLGEGGGEPTSEAVTITVALPEKGCGWTDEHTYVVEAEGQPVYFGVDAYDICWIRVQGEEDEFWGIDNLTFLAVPRCERFVDGVEENEIVGAADAFYPDDIVSMQLLGNANGNLTLMHDSLPDSYVGFTVTYDEQSGLPGQGAVLATDDDGETCRIDVDFRVIGAGPVTNQVVCQTEGLLFEMEEGTSTDEEISACSFEDYDTSDPALPPGYFPFPACKVLTIVGPYSGPSIIDLKVDGTFNPALRLMFSRLVGFDFEDFQDVTTEVQEIANIVPDPTRLSGTPQWSTVKVTCAEQDIDCEALGVAGEIDADADTYPLCVDGVIVDCNDQLADVNPAGTEICNGLDDDCDGTVDEGFFGMDADLVADCFDNCPTISNQAQIDTDADGTGDACEPDNINAAMTQGSITLFYTPNTMGGLCPSGVFTISAPFTNGSQDTFFDMGFEVAVLTGGNTVLGATGGSPEGGPGAVLAIPPATLGGDGVLTPGESFTEPIPVCLVSLGPFDLFINVLGVAQPLQ